MTKIQIKPLSVNEAWKGRRFKTKTYQRYEQDMMLLLPRITIPKGALHIYVNLGFSNESADIDNPLKPLLDILQKAYNFNDKRIYKLTVEKRHTKKGCEYVEFFIKSAV